jgi:hypothetical protein
LAAHIRWSKTINRTAATAAAREGLLVKFENQVDPDGELTPGVRRKLAENARNAHMRSMSFRASTSRRKRKGEAA